MSYRDVYMMQASTTSPLEFVVPEQTDQGQSYHKIELITALRMVW